MKTIGNINAQFGVVLEECASTLTQGSDWDDHSEGKGGWYFPFPHK